MKWLARYLAICLLAGIALVAQGGQTADQSQAPNHSPAQGPAPGDLPASKHGPTLGPQSGPSMGTGPDTSTTIDVRRLMRIHTIYIENIDNALSDKLVDSLGKWGRFRLVTKAKDADATLRGSCLESRRLKHVHSEIFISDRGGKSIWQDSIYRPFNPPTLDQAVVDTANVVAAHLQRTMLESDRH
jgi:hypothetical protein